MLILKNSYRDVYLFTVFDTRIHFKVYSVKIFWSYLWLWPYQVFCYLDLFCPNISNIFYCCIDFSNSNCCKTSGQLSSENCLVADTRFLLHTFSSLSHSWKLQSSLQRFRMPNNDALEFSSSWLYSRNFMNFNIHFFLQLFPVMNTHLFIDKSS